MGLTEEEVFQRVTQELSDRDYDFIVNCRYDSILTQYKSHSMVISNGIPDIIGLAPDNTVIAIEVKGDDDIRKGIGQASDYKVGSNASYLAADEESLASYQNNIRSAGLGAISASKSGVIEWREPPKIENKTALPEIRSRLLARIRGLRSFTKIASLNLAHPANFLAPVIFLEYHADTWGPMSKDEFLDQYQRNSHLRETITQEAIEGASILNLIDYSSKVTLTDQGKLGLTVLREYDITSLQGLENLIGESSNSSTVKDISPMVGVWLLDQYRKQPDFEALYGTLQSFEAGEHVPLTDISARLIRDHPNTFLRLFCTRSPNSREYARNLILEGNPTQIHDDLDTFRQVIRQNLIQNFTRQLQHIGVLSPKTSSTTKRLEDYIPTEYPWVLPEVEYQTQLKF